MAYQKWFVFWLCLLWAMGGLFVIAIAGFLPRETLADVVPFLLFSFGPLALSLSWIIVALVLRARR